MTVLRRRLPWREPAEVATVLAHLHGEQGLIWLDGDGGELGGRITLAADPLEQHCCRGLPGDPDATNPFSRLRQLSPGHWTGWLSYDAAAWTEPTNPWRADAMASLWIARHDPVLRFDLQAKELHLEGIDPTRHAAMGQQLETHLIEAIAPEVTATQRLRCQWHRHSNRDAFMAGVTRIRELIASGDLFQANLTACASATLPHHTSNLALYQRLRHRCPAPFSGLLVGGATAAGEAVLSTSPERFLEVMPGGAVQTRPIKLSLIHI